jgi:hypothetical protein
MSGEIHVAIQFMRLEGHFSFQVLSAVPNRHDAFLSSLTITFAPSTDSNGLFGALTARAGGLISSCVLHCVLHCIFAFTHVTEKVDHRPFWIIHHDGFNIFCHPRGIIEPPVTTWLA